MPFALCTVHCGNLHSFCKHKISPPFFTACFIVKTPSNVLMFFFGWKIRSIAHLNFPRPLEVIAEHTHTHWHKGNSAVDVSVAVHAVLINCSTIVGGVSKNSVGNQHSATETSHFPHFHITTSPPPPSNSLSLQFLQFSHLQL